MSSVDVSTRGRPPTSFCAASGPDGAAASRFTLVHPRMAWTDQREMLRGMEELVHLERRDDGVAVITRDNPRVNALSGALLRRLHEIVDTLATDLHGAVVVTGGERIIAAGADMSEFGGPDEAGVIGATIHGTLDALAALPRFVIAAV